MTNKNTNSENTDFYTINNDYTGQRDVRDAQELVEYHEQTTHRIWFNEQTENYDTHWHSAMEIVMPIENWYDVEVSGTAFRLSPGDILITAPRLLHSTKAPDSGSRFIFLMDISSIENLKGFSGISSIMSGPLLFSRADNPIVYDDISQILVQIRNTYFKNDEYAELIIQSLLLELFVRIGENHSNSDELFPNVRPNKHKDYVQRFNQLLEYIDDHYMEELYLDDVADLAGFSKYHFSRLFKQYTNFTFCDYLTHRRIKAATELLSDPDYSVTDVAMDSGFQSISTFNRLFKLQVGCTPREYRNKYNRRGNRL